MDVREPSPTHFRGRVTPPHALDLYVASPHSLIHPTLASTLSSTCRTGPSIAITDEASPFALRSTRNRLRRAVRRGAPWTVERHEPLPGRCRGSGDLAVSHRRAVSGCELASAASTGTIRRPSGSSSCGGGGGPTTCDAVRRPVRCPRVSCPRPPCGCRGGFVERVGRGQSALGRLGRGRPRTAEHAWVVTTRLAGHLVGWHRNPPWVVSSGQPLTRGRGGTRPGSRKPDELRSLVREGCMASHETLSSEWIGCGDHA
jgi:hypothetical protein